MSGSLRSVPVVSLLAFCLLHTVWAEGNTTSSPDCWTRPADVMWLLALTRNMSIDEFKQVKGLVTYFINMPVISSTRVNMGLLVAKDSDSYMQYFLNSHANTTELLKTMEKLNYWPPDRINITKGLDIIHEEAFSADNGDREDIPNALIVITDGMYESELGIEAEAETFREQNIDVYVVGIHNAKDRDLQKIAPKQQNVFNVIDFDALDNLTAIKGIFCEDCRDHPADVMWLFDISNNVDESGFVKVKNFVKKFTEEFSLSDLNTGVATVSRMVQTALSLKNHTKEGVISAVDDICYWPSQRTNTTEGLKFIHENAFTKDIGDRESIPNALIVVTDGRSENESDIEAEAIKIHEKNIIVFVVGINSADEDELKKITSNEQHVFSVTDLDESESLNIITNTFCKEIFAASYDTSSETRTKPSSETANKTITTSTSDTPSDTNTTLSSETDLEINTTSSSKTDSESNTTLSSETDLETNTTSSSKTAPEINATLSSETDADINTTLSSETDPERDRDRERQRQREKRADSTSSSETRSSCQSRPADVMWLLDLSDSVRTEDFVKVKVLMKHFTQKPGISPTGLHTGVFTVDTGAHEEFFLNAHSSTEDVIAAIDKISYWPPKRTNIVKGLDLIRTAAFTKEKDERDGIPNTLIVVTDGMSEDQSGIADEIAKLRAMNIDVFAVGIGNADDNELTKIASQKQNVFRVTDFNALDRLTGLTDIFCKRAGPTSTTAAPPPQCNYNGKKYAQDAKWQDGCALDCECVDAADNKYTCNNKCPEFTSMPPQCMLVQPPGLCCHEPVCDFHAVYHVASGRNMDSLDGYKVCVYEGEKYYQGQSWTVGCDMECSCYDATVGHFICRSKCPQYEMLASTCRMVRKPDECCAMPECAFYTQMGMHVGVGRPTGQNMPTSFFFIT